MSIEVGAKLQGKVSGITNFGAFIDLGEGKTGLVHILSLIHI
ncbi:S1 RNA-binding domain-containing protein, partial [Enterococcus sp. S181_ASV_20]|nr:S1 RNA-binding domain-containing protein [Enterococcus sp. S181_ASV_20]